MALAANCYRPDADHLPGLEHASTDLELLIPSPGWSMVSFLSRSSHQGQLRAPEPIQLQQDLAGLDQAPPGIVFILAPDLEAAQALRLFNQAVDLLDDGFTQGIDRHLRPRIADSKARMVRMLRSKPARVSALVAARGAGGRWRYRRRPSCL